MGIPKDVVMESGEIVSVVVGKQLYESIKAPLLHSCLNVVEEACSVDTRARCAWGWTKDRDP